MWTRNGIFSKKSRIDENRLSGFREPSLDTEKPK
jgi:hypothetical protein